MTTRTKAILGLSGVFILGLLCGALALGMFVRDVVRERDQLRNPAGFREYFADELNLNDAQKDSLQNELEYAYLEMADIRRQVEAEYRQVFDTLAARIAPVLTPAQRQLLASQKERLLPKREKPDQAEKHLPSIDEIDHTVAQTPSPAPHDTTPNSAVKDQSLVKEDEKTNAQSEGTKSEGGAGSNIASPGDSILSAETEEEQLPRIFAHMKRQLNLTDEQMVTVQDLVRKAVRRNSWIRQNFQDQPFVRGRRLLQSFKLLDRQVMDLLTEDQTKVYSEMKRARQEAMKKRFGKN